MAKFCNKCGSKLRDASRFCNTCGNPLSAPSSGQTAAQSVPAWPSVSEAQAAAVQNPFSAPQAQPIQAPQYFESYDFNSPTPESISSLPEYVPSPSGQIHGASKPLPPLSDFFGESSDLEDKREKAKDTIMNFSLWAAGIVILPIPFADFFLLMPLQTALIFAIAKIYGVKEPTKNVISIISASCGVSLVGNLTAVVLSNCIPIVGKLVSAPVIFGWIYGVGQVSVKYFESKGSVDQSELKNIFKQASKEAASLYDPSKVASAKTSLDNLKNFMSEEEYQKIRSRFSDNA